MAPQPRPKRKSGPEDDNESENNCSVAAADDSSNKRVKTTRNATSSPAGASGGICPPPPPQVDSDGNQYWEISKMRRVATSEFRGKNMVTIREYYEKDGKELPGKKCYVDGISFLGLRYQGISMTVEQYSALVELMPQIERTLEKKGEKNIGRPNYSAFEAGQQNGSQVDEEEHDQADAQVSNAGENQDGKARSKGKRSNIEATSDEDEGV